MLARKPATVPTRPPCPTSVHLRLDCVIPCTEDAITALSCTRILCRVAATVVFSLYSLFRYDSMTSSMTPSMISAGSPTRSLGHPWQRLSSLGASIGLLLSVLLVSGCDSPSSTKTPVADKSGSATAGPSSATEALAGTVAVNPGKLTKVSLLLNWYPEAEHGGFYAAKVHGIFEKYGLDVEIQPGGKTTVVPQTLTLGRVQFGVANADDVLVARNQDIPLVALMAPIQQGPRCIMVRADSGIKSFQEFKNLTFQVDSTRPYVPFLRSKGLLDDSVKLAPYFGSVAQLVAGPGYAAQGYTFSEPFMAKQQGVEVTQLMMSDIGYNPYASLLVTTGTYLKDHQDICRNMVKASIEGWQKYLTDPTASNEVILKNNKQGLERDALVYGVEALKPLCTVNGDLTGVGQMTRERWVELSDTLVDLKLIDRAKVNVDASFNKDLLK